MGSEKNLHMSEIRDECATSKSKPQILLLMAKPNTSKDVNALSLMMPLLMNLKDKLKLQPY